MATVCDCDRSVVKHTMNVSDVGDLLLGELIDHGHFSKVFRAVAATGAGAGQCCAVKVTVCTNVSFQRPVACFEQGVRVTNSLQWLCNGRPRFSL